MTPDPKTPAFTIDKLDVFHSYKDDEPASYWYRLTPDPCGTCGKGEDLTGAFDVRDLNHPDQPQLKDYTQGDWNTQYKAYRVDFLEWVKTSITKNRQKITEITIK